MKKNKMMRLASILLVLTLLSTCAISGTFAKYVTSDSATDTARVAKWGVTASITNDPMFSTTYASDTSGYTDNTVVSSGSEKLVAPGTKNDTGVSFTIGGAPEVAVKVEAVFTATKDVKLAAGTYTDNPTTGDLVEDPYTLAKDYTPVKYTLTKDGTKVVDGKTLADVATYINALSGDYAANTGLSAINGTYKLTWAWDYSNGDDVADTILGNAAVTAISGASTEIAYSLSITITQID